MITDTHTLDVLKLMTPSKSQIHELNTERLIESFNSMYRTIFYKTVQGEQDLELQRPYIVDIIHHNTIDTWLKRQWLKSYGHMIHNDITIFDVTKAFTNIVYKNDNRFIIKPEFRNFAKQIRIMHLILNKLTEKEIKDVILT